MARVPPYRVFEEQAGGFRWPGRPAHRPHINATMRAEFPDGLSFFAGETTRRAREEEARERALREEVDACLKRLTPGQRAALEAEALAQAGP